VRSELSAPTACLPNCRLTILYTTRDDALLSWIDTILEQIIVARHGSAELESVRGTMTHGSLLRVVLAKTHAEPQRDSEVIVEASALAKLEAGIL
jgi:hypothetical protein